MTLSPVRLLPVWPSPVWWSLLPPVSLLSRPPSELEEVVLLLEWLLPVRLEPEWLFPVRPVLEWEFPVKPLVPWVLWLPCEEDPWLPRALPAMPSTFPANSCIYREQTLQSGTLAG